MKYSLQRRFFQLLFSLPLLSGCSSSGSDAIDSVLGKFSSSPVLTAVPLQIVSQEELLSVDINNVKDGSPGNDVGMSYTCYYDQAVDGVVAGTQECSTIPNSNVTFDPGSGKLLWTPQSSVLGNFEVKIKGLFEGLMAEVIFPVSVRLKFAGITQFTQVTGNSVTVNWVPNPQAQSYQILKLNPITGQYEIFRNVADGASSGTVITGLAPSTGYTLKVQAIDILGNPDGNVVARSFTTTELVKLSMSSTATTLAAGSTATITVNAFNADNSPQTVGGLNVSPSLVSGTSIGTFSAVTDNNNGSYSFTYSPTTVGTPVHIEITTDITFYLINPINITVVPGAPSSLTSSLQLSANSIVSGTSATLTATIRDANNNPIANSSVVEFLKTSGTSTGTLGTVTNQGNGVYTVTYLGVAAGTAQIISVSVNGSPLALSSSLTVTPGTPLAANSTLTISQSALPAGSDANLTATLRDLNNNPVYSGILVTFNKSGGTSTGSIGSVVNTGNGIYTATYSGLSAGTAQTISVSVDGAPLTQTVTVRVVPGPASVANSSLVASNSTVTSGNFVNLTATIRDANNNPIDSGVTVNFTKSGGTSTGSFGAVSNQGGGIYTIRYNGIKSGSPQSIVMTVDGSPLGNPVNITVQNGSPSATRSTLTVASATVISGQSVAITATIKDDNDNLISSGYAVSFAKSGGTSTGDLDTTVNAGAGVYTTLYTGVTAGSAQTINLQIDGSSLGLNVSIAVNVGGPSASLSTLSLSSATINSGQTSSLTAVIKDSNGNRISSGISVAFLKSGGTSTGTLSSVTNQGNGVYTAIYSGLVAGTAQTISLTVDNLDMGFRPNLTVVPATPSPDRSTLSIASPTVAAGDSVLISATIRDLNDNLISSGAAITFAKSGGTSTGDFGSVTNGGNGIYTISYTGLTSGTAQTINLQVDGTSLGPVVNVTVNVGAPSPTLSTLSLSSSSISSGQTSTATATIKDANGNRIASGITVSFAKSGGTSSGTFGSITNQGNGVYTIVYTGITAGTAQAIRLSVNGSDMGLQSNLSVVPAAPASDHSTIVTSLASVTAGSSITVTATVRDLNDNPISSGVAITFSKTGGSSTGSFGSITNAGAGVYTTTYTGVTAGSPQTLSILVDGFSLGPATTVTVIPGAPSNMLSTLTISANTVTAGQNVTLTATIKDANGNPISSGIVVGFDKFGGTSTGEYSAVINQGAGVYTTTYMGANAGTAQTVQANVNLTGFGPSQSVQVLVGAPSATNSTLTIASASIVSGASTTITAQILDSQNNPITSQNVISFDASGGTSTGAISAIANSGTGTFTATYTGMVAGTAQTIRVFSDGNPIASLTRTITVTAGVPSATNSSFTVGSTSVQSSASTTLSISLRDANANAISALGTAIAFTKTAGVSDGTISAVTNNGNGNYSATYTGTSMGTAQTIGLIVNGVSTGMTLNVSVTAGPPTHLNVAAVLNPVASIDCNGPYTLTLKDSNENTTTSNSTVTIAIASTPSGRFAGTIFSDSACTNSVNSLSVQSPNSYVQFYYKSNIPQTISLDLTPNNGVATVSIPIGNYGVVSWIGASAYFTMNGSGTNTVQDDSSGGSMSPTDVAINGDYMYVVDSVGLRILKYQISTSALIGWIGHVGSIEGISTYDGTSTCSGLVPASGTLTPKWCLGGRSNPTNSALLTGVKYIAVDSTFIYLSSNHRILRFRQDDGSYQGWFGRISSISGISPASCASAGVGATTPVWCSGGSNAAGTPDGQFNNVGGLSVNSPTVSTTYLYVADTSNQRIQKINVSSESPAFSGWIGLVLTQPSAVGQYSTCSPLPAVAATTPGWCTGGTSQVSSRYNLQVTPTELVPPNEGFYNPYGITNDGTYLYVADRNNYRVVRVLMSTGENAGWVGYLQRSTLSISPTVPQQAGGNYTSTWTQGGVVNATTGTLGFGALQGITNDGTYLYMTDDYHRITRILISTGQDYRWIGRTTSSPTGGYSGCSSTPIGGVTPGWCVGGGANRAGNLNSSFYSPIGLAVTNTKIYVTDSANFRTQRFIKSTGVFDGWIGSGNSYAARWTRGLAIGASPSRSGIDDYSLGDTSTFNGIAIYDNNLFQTDYTFHRIKKINKTEGTMIGYIGQIGTFPPTGPDACIGYTSGMTPFWCVGGGRTSASSGIQGYNNPFAVTSDGTYLYVADYSNHRIDRVQVSDGLYLGWIGRVNGLPTDGDSGCTTASAGNYTPGWCIGGSATATSASAQVQNPRSVFYNADATVGNYLYVAEANRILKVDPSNGVISGVLGSLNSVSGCTTVGNVSTGWCNSGIANGASAGYGGLNSVYSVAANSNFIFTIDPSNNRLQRYDKSSGAPAGFVARMTNVNNIYTLTATVLVNGTSQTNYCAGLGTGYPRETPGWCYGTLLGTTINTPVSTDGSTNGFSSPRGVWADDTYVYVTDTGNSRIVRVNAVTGAFMGWKGLITSTSGMSGSCLAAGVGAVTPTWCYGGTSGPGRQLGAFDLPFGITADANYLYVVDGRNNRTVTIPR